MVRHIRNLGVQALLVLSGSPSTVEVSPRTLVSNTELQPILQEPTRWSQVVSSSLSTAPTIYDYELATSYREVGSALAEMKELEAGDIGAIEPAVYETARHIATELMNANYPAPKIFTHGPRSVVFNWDHNRNNLYLTVSSDTVSVLLSSPATIQTRYDVEASKVINPTVLLQTVALTNPRAVATQERATTQPRDLVIG